MNARIAAACVVVASALTLAGCGTVDNMCLENERTGQIPMHIYGGVEADFKFLSEDDPSSRDKSAIDPFKIVYLTADLPLSFVADTVTLPVTIPMAYFEKESHRTNPFPKVPGSNGSTPPPPPQVQDPANNGSGNPEVPPGFTPVSR